MTAAILDSGETAAQATSKLFWAPVLLSIEPAHAGDNGGSAGLPVP
jgi:hypothetical protein